VRRQLLARGLLRGWGAAHGGLLNAVSKATRRLVNLQKLQRIMVFKTCWQSCRLSGVTLSFLALCATAFTAAHALPFSPHNLSAPLPPVSLCKPGGSSPAFFCVEGAKFTPRGANYIRLWPEDAPAYHGCVCSQLLHKRYTSHMLQHLFPVALRAGQSRSCR